MHDDACLHSSLSLSLSLCVRLGPLPSHKDTKIIVNMGINPSKNEGCNMTIEKVHKHELSNSDVSPTGTSHLKTPAPDPQRWKSFGESFSSTHPTSYLELGHGPTCWDDQP